MTAYFSCLSLGDHRKGQTETQQKHLVSESCLTVLLKLIQGPSKYAVLDVQRHE